MGDASLTIGMLNQGLQPDISYHQAIGIGHVIRTVCDRDNLDFLLDTNCHGHEEGFATTACGKIPEAIRCIYDPDDSVQASICHGAFGTAYFHGEQPIRNKDVQVEPIFDDYASALEDSPLYPKC